ncbi:MAG: carboxypeptidase regulatory-like domain-containing protein [Caulobacteraceae bacterium]
MLTRKLAAGVALGALALAASTAAYAQQTTGSIRGQVTDDAGKPVSGVTITVTHVPTGTKATSVTGADGGYNLLNLRPGGPYTVEAADSTHTPQKVDVPNIALGSTTDLNIALTSGGADVRDHGRGLAIQGRDQGSEHRSAQPCSARSRSPKLPSLNRDIKDLLQRSPLVTLDPTNSNALIVAGANNRVNTIYVDGVKQADDFGLNANGYPSQNEPFSIDWVKDLDFEVAPYDVQYGEFQGGLINVVTKEGSNAFHGSVYYQGNNSAYAGASFQQDDGADQRTIKVLPFYKQTWGGDLGGPIIPDKLFFFGGYEEFRSGTVPNSFGPADGNAANKVANLTQAEVDDITNIMKTVYHFDPLGDTSGTLPQTDDRWFARLDWNITDKQRLMVSYQEDDGISLSDGNSNSNSQLTLLSQYYNLDQNLKAYNVQLFSDWTDQFSTEFAYNRKEVNSVRKPLAGNTFAQFQIRLDVPTGLPPGSNMTPASVLLGPDISSQANVLDNTDELFRFRAHYKVGDHVLTAGYERESLSVFNLFDQNATGAYIFATNTSTSSGVACYPGFTVLQDLAMGQACSVTYANSASNVATAAAANWSDVDNIAYIQDEWSVLPDLTVKLGLRDEFYTDSTVPGLNVAGFQNVYGFANTATFNGRSVLMPRFGFNWRPDDSFTLTGGFGLFAGGDPNVWLSNSYTNTGLLIGSVNCALSSTGGRPATNSCTTATGPTLTGINAITGSPMVTPTVTALNTASANSGAGITNFVDPNFKLPSTWKGSLSFVKVFGLPWIGDDWRLHGDFLYQAVNEGITWKDIALNAVTPGTAPDGRPTLQQRPLRQLRSDHPLLLQPRIDQRPARRRRHLGPRRRQDLERRLGEGRRLRHQLHPLQRRRHQPGHQFGGALQLQPVGGQRPQQSHRGPVELQYQMAGSIEGGLHPCLLQRLSLEHPGVRRRPRRLSVQLHLLLDRQQQRQRGRPDVRRGRRGCLQEHRTALCAESQRQRECHRHQRPPGHLQPHQLQRRHDHRFQRVLAPDRPDQICRPDRTPERLRLAGKC